MENIFNSETPSFVPQTDCLEIGKINKENFVLGNAGDRFSTCDYSIASAMTFEFPLEINKAMSAGESGSLIPDDSFDLEKMVDDALPKIQELLQYFAENPVFEVEMGLAFGNNYDQEKADILKSAFSERNFSIFPQFKIIDGDLIKGAKGAFSQETETIYLAKNFLRENTGNIELIADVIVEEFGHYIDSTINQFDAPGDEGEIFANLVQSKDLNQQQLQRLKTQDDWATLNIDGLVIEIEQAAVSDSGGFEGSNQTLVLESPGSVSLAIQYEMFEIPDSLTLRYEGQNILDTGFISGSSFLQVDVPEGKSNQVQIILATNDEGTKWNYTVTTDLSILPDDQDSDPNTPDGPKERNPEEEKRNEEEGDEECKLTAPGTSEVELHSGAVLETHELVPYQSLGVNRGFVLTYDSSRADPNETVYFGFDNVISDPNTRLVGELDVAGDNFNSQVPGYQGTNFGLDGGEHFWSIPNTSSEGTNNITAALEVDMSNAPSGQYNYNLTSGLKQLVDGTFTGNSNTTTGNFLTVNSINSPFGSGWGMAGWQELVENSDRSVLLIDGDGSELLYKPPVNPGEAYVSPAADFSTLEKLADGTFRRTLKSQTTYTYNAQNQLQLIEDRNGNQTRYVYNNANQLIEMIDPVGLTTTLAYTNGKVSTITDPVGRVTQLTYDSTGNLIQVTDPDGSQRTWEYDGEHRMTGETDQRGNREQMIYGLAGRADRAILKDGQQIDYSPVQVQGLYSPTATLNPINAPSAFILDPDPVAVYVDANGKIISNELDQRGQTVTSFDEIGALPMGTRNNDNLIATQTDARGNVTQFDYDERGNLLTVVDQISSAATSQQSLTYDPLFNQLTTITDELGRKTLYEIDPTNGNVLSMTEVVAQVGGDDDLITRFTYTPQGLVDLMISPMAEVMDQDYDSLGRLIKKTFAVGTPDQAIQIFEYNAVGNNTAVIDENGNRTEFVYDQLNQLALVRDPMGHETRLTYDQMGNTVNIVDALGNQTQNVYDPMNRLTQIIDSNNQISRFEYDGVGNLITVIDPLGNIARNQYDARSRLLTSTDPQAGITSFSYDGDDNLSRIVDPVGNNTAYTYDARSRVTSEIQTYKPSKPITYEYDLVNNLIAQTDRNGRRTQFEYDDLNRLMGETWVGGDNTIGYSYDKGNNLTAVQDKFSGLAFAYDNRDRLISVDNAGTPEAPNVVLNYAYDSVGNVIEVSDLLNGQRGGTNRYVYNPMNMVNSITQSGIGVSDKRVDFSYNELSQFNSINRYSDFNATKLVTGTNYRYDTLNRLTEMTHSNATSPVAVHNFTYDTASRITQIAGVDGTTNYTYDKKGQLIAANSTNPLKPNEFYDYDPNGNRFSSSQHPDGYQTGSHNQTLSDNQFNYVYDNQGNLIRKTEIATGKLQEYQWDYRNRLLAVVDKAAGGQETQRVEFTYDAFDRRITKQVGDKITDFVYDGQDVYADFVDNDGNGGKPPVLDKRYLHGPGTDQILAQEDANGKVLWDLTDHLGSVSDLVDNSGAVQNHIIYDSFGNVLSQSNPDASSRYLFTGREFDRETGLQFNRARYYDPGTGKFLSEDPIGFDGGDGNLYRYVWNNSINLIDSLGLWGVGLIGGGSVEAGVVYGIREAAEAGQNGYGAGATGSFGDGVFFGGEKGVNSGAFLSGGYFKNFSSYESESGVCTGQKPFVFGASAGVGGGGFLTNANSVEDLSGPFDTYSLNIPGVSLQFGYSNGIGIASAIVGPSLGLNFSGYPTTTVTTPSFLFNRK